jgi:hypothetical protein
LVLTGCASWESTIGPIGTSATPAAAPAAAGGEGAAKAEIDCPTVTVRTGASAWMVTAGGSGPTNVRYQGSIGQIARECAVLGETMTMRVGVEGRILVGPKGGPGSVNVPLRIALVQEGPKPRPLWSKFYSVPVSVPAGASQAIFSQVEDDVTFPLPANKNLDSYVVYVGFDPKGAVDTAKTKTKPKAKTAPAPRTAKAKPKPPEKSTAPTRPAPAGGSPFDPPPGHGT